jgi:HEAT repeat protein
VKRFRGRSIAIGLALGAAALLGLAGYAARHRILEEWYLHRLESHTPGSNHAGDSSIRLETIAWLGRFGSVRAVPALAAILDSKITAERDAAIEALGSLGPMAVEAVPVLVRLLVPESESASQETTAVKASGLVENALSRIGPRSIPALSASLQMVVLPSKLASMIVRFDEGIPHLISLLGHEHDVVRTAVRAALRSNRDRTAGPLLEAVVDPRDPDLGRLATHVLLTLGQEALAGNPATSIEAFPRLNAARKEPQPEPATRGVLAWILGIDAERMRTLDAHIDAGFCIELRVTALYSIRRSPDRARQILPDLIDCLLTDTACRPHAADTLAILGRPAWEALLEILAGSDPVAALWAESTLADAGSRRAEAAATIVAALPGKPEPLRRRLVEILHRTCQTGVKALREACASPDEAVRPLAAQALAEIEARS